MSWFRDLFKDDEPKTEEGIILESLREKKVPDPIAAMFLEEYRHTRRKSRKEAPLRELPETNQLMPPTPHIFAELYTLRKVTDE